LRTMMMIFSYLSAISSTSFLFHLRVTWYIWWWSQVKTTGDSMCSTKVVDFLVGRDDRARIFNFIFSALRRMTNKKPFRDFLSRIFCSTCAIRINELFDAFRFWVFYWEKRKSKVTFCAWESFLRIFFTIAKKFIESSAKFKNLEHTSNNPLRESSLIN
jgi:hypothetical protein